jgi:phospholipid transport system substrate-binding protein
MSKSALTRRSALSHMFAFAALVGAYPAVAVAADAAESYVADVGNQVIAAARVGSTDTFRNLLRQNADVPTIALFSLGAYRKNIADGQKTEYFNLVEDYIAKVFAQNSKKLAGKSLDVTGSQPAGDSVIVKSNLIYDDGHSQPVVWRLVKSGDGFRIFDVNVEGIWLATTQKTNFTSLLKQNNGNISALLDYLKQS